MGEIYEMITKQKLPIRNIYDKSTWTNGYIGDPWPCHLEIYGVEHDVFTLKSDFDEWEGMPWTLALFQIV